MKKIKIGNGYITNVELSCGEIYKIEISDNEQPVSFKEENAKQLKTLIEEHYKNKNIIVEIAIEDI